MPIVCVLSPAKTLNLKPLSASNKGGIITTPEFLKDANILVSKLKNYSSSKLGSLLGVSKALTSLNYDRYQDFETAETLPCAYMYDGPAYKGLDARTSLTKESSAFATDRFGILSGLFGILRPLDAIQPYRLEMGMKVNDQSLYDFWGSKISKSINARFKKLEKKSPKVLLNLASQEYFKSVDLKALDSDVAVVSVTFKDDGKVKSVYAKKARGLMVKFVIQNNIDSIEEVKDFDLEGYVFDVKNSSDSELIFNRSKAEAAKVVASKKRKLK